MNKITDNSHAVAKSFSKAARNYQANAKLQKKTATWILEHAATHTYSNILDIGCGTGWLIKRLATGNKPAFGIDISRAMLEQAAAKKLAATWVEADLRALPFATASFDLITANLSLQWSPSIHAAISECRRVLAPNGKCFFSVPLNGSLQQIANAWRAAGSNKQHINNFLDLSSWQQLLEDMHLNCHSASRQFVQQFESPQQALFSIKNIGASKLLVDQQRGLTGKGIYQKMLRAYAQYKVDNYYPLSYQIGLFTISKK